MDNERRAIWLENGLIIAAIVLLWPAILRLPKPVTGTALGVAFLLMVFVLYRRWTRLFKKQ